MKKKENWKQLIERKTGGKLVVICRYFIPPLIMVEMPDGKLELFIPLG